TCRRSWFGWHRLAGDGQAALGVGAHLVEGGLVRAADLLAVCAGLGSGVDGNSSRSDSPHPRPLPARGRGAALRDGSVAGRAHLVEGGLADARDGVWVALEL